ncbi:MAG TPA: Ig-like domain-containing protein, partial [Ilumatobacteraceae bacterium]|nr:Ig-like domain-containing protein [Ilumatobacteraceae bacterium]
EALSIAGLDGQPSWVSFVPGAINASPPAGAVSGPYTFRATISDPGGLTAVATINLTINNLPPTAVADSYTTDQFQYSFRPALNDTDTEPGPLTVQVVTPLDPSDQVLSNDGTLVTVSVDHGVSKFNYTIIDSGGLTASSTITIKANRPPTADNNESVNTDQPTANVTLSPIDPDGDELTTVCPPNGAFQIDVINDPAPDAPGRVRVHMDFQGWKGSTVVTCISTDTFGESTESKISVFAS